jgi:hypothetical protein
MDGDVSTVEAYSAPSRAVLALQVAGDRQVTLAKGVSALSPRSRSLDDG